MITAAGLVGRGGAAFPTGRKWAAVAAQPVFPHHLIANADESEPGTFKDRVLMEGDPFALIESMTIAAFATGCERGWIYLRGEYPDAESTLARAIDAARTAGLLGDDVMGAGFAFDVEIVRGAGAYICGEETAIFNSIEGYRGEPRNKPPFPVEVGLFGRPTVVNNVETLMNVPLILRHGVEAFRAVGTAESAGPKLFCVSGTVVDPGVYEVPFGTTLRGADRPRGRSRSTAVRCRPCCSAEPPVPSSVRTTSISRCRWRPPAPPAPRSAPGWCWCSTTPSTWPTNSAGSPRSSATSRAANACRAGSAPSARRRCWCASTTPDGQRPDDLALLRDLAQVMRDASICGLGQTAPSAILSAVDRLGALR